MTDRVIDIAALKRLLHVIGGDTEDLRELLDEFLETAPDLAASITSAAVAGNRDNLRIASHTLKSNARDFGAIRLSELCAELERDCREEGIMDPRAAAARIAEEELHARRALGTLSLEGLGQDS
jgi:HPt (histidine-containing phosphotransfer) domain-containing protein